MKVINAIILLFISLIPKTMSIEPISTVGSILGAIGITAIYSSWEYIKCTTNECCHEMNKFPRIHSYKYKQWINYNLPFNVLHKEVSDKLYGQPLAHRIVPKLITSHLTNEDPQKPLVLSFHGWTGGGKNHLTRIIANNIYQKFNDTQRSDFVNLIIATHFRYDNANNDNIKRFLQNNITEGVKRCPRSLFIIDEIDKMPPHIIDAIKPFLDYHPNVNGVDYRKAIFIFLSNTGGKEIAKVTYEFWKNGKNRDEITMKHLEPLINSGAFNEIGGLRLSDIVEKHLIDAFIPFLPLERKHIKQCTADYLEKRYKIAKHEMITDKISDFIDSIADEMEYYPPDSKLYSATGCKKVDAKVNALFWL